MPGRRLTILCALTLVLISVESQAAKKIVLLPFSGPKGSEASHYLAKSLTGRYEMVSPSRFHQEGKARGANINDAGGRSTAARALKLTAIITGSMQNMGSKWLLRITVLSGHSGRPVAVLSFPLRGPRIDPLSGQRATAGINQAMSRARPGPPISPAIASKAGHEKNADKNMVVASSHRSTKSAKNRQPISPAPRMPSSTEGDTDEIAETDDGSSVNSSKAKSRKPVPPTTYRETVSPEDNSDNNGMQPPPTAGGGEMAEDEPRHQRAPAVREMNSDPDSEDNGNDLGFEVNGKRRSQNSKPSRFDDEASAPKQKKKKAKHQRPVWERGIEVNLGVSLIARTLTFYDAATENDAANYQGGMVPAFYAEGSLYPFAFMSDVPLTNLGIYVDFYRTIQAKSQMTHYTEPVSTILQHIEIGPRFRLNIFNKASSPILKFGINYGWQAFIIDWPSSLALPTSPTPNVTYQYLNFGALEGTVPLYQVNSFSAGLTINIDLIYAFSAGEIEIADSGGYGASKTFGLDLAGGLFAEFGNLSFKVNGFYRRIGFAFQECQDCRQASGALDIYMGLIFKIGYAY